MKTAILEELAGTWEVMAEMDKGMHIARREALRECADTLRMLASTQPAEADRQKQLEELLRSACAIAERKGAGTAWERFTASVNALGLNGVTARTYRVLPGIDDA